MIIIGGVEGGCPIWPMQVGSSMLGFSMASSVTISSLRILILCIANWC